MLSIIKEYNKDKAEDDQITFLHGGSSVPIAIAGKKVGFKKYKENKTIKTSIPAAIFPGGLLRKKYGIHPLSGERHMGTFFAGNRKRGVNYNFVSGMGVDREGINVVSSYAKNYGKPSRTLHEEILNQLSMIDAHYKASYIISLKKLVMFCANLWITDPETAKKNANDYIGLLKNEYKNILLNHPEDEQRIKKYFDKYISRIEDILNGKAITFSSDEQFQKEIANQYPVIFCSTAESKPFFYGLVGERTHEGALPLSTVKIMFTLPEYKKTLQSKMEELGLTVQVHGLMAIEKNKEKETKGEKIDSSFLKFMDASNLNVLIKESKTISLNKDICTKKIKSCLENFVSEEKGEEYFKMAWWLLKDAKTRRLDIDLYSLRDQYSKEVSGFETQKEKLAVDPDYLHVASQYLHKDLQASFPKFQKISYLYHLADFLFISKTTLFDYPQEVSNIENNLNQRIKYHTPSQILGILDKIFHILNEDQKYYPEHAPYINACLKIIKHRIYDLLEDPEFKKDENIRKYNLLAVVLKEKSEKQKEEIEVEERARLSSKRCFG